MKRVLFFAFSVFLLAVIQVVRIEAQTMSSVKRYLEKGEYLEAAKQLRPLADGGDAEAQILAAQLFFEGKGVNKNDEQGVKYAKLAADQGNEAAILLLANHYAATQQYELLFQTASSYARWHPYMKKGALGLRLAECYIKGLGVEKDETLGWNILKENDGFERLLNTDSWASMYWDFMCRSNEVDDLESLARKIGGWSKFNSKADSTYRKLVSYLDNRVYKEDKTRLRDKAEAGNTWAMCHLAETIYDENKNSPSGKEKALEWARMAADAGSEEGRVLVERISFVPQVYNNIQVGIIPAQSFGSTIKLESACIDYDTIALTFLYTRAYSGWVMTAKNTYLMCNGKRYELISSTLPMEPKKLNMGDSSQVRYVLTLERIPSIGYPFDLVEGKYGRWKDIKIIN